ncbi:hypothetical protein ACFL0Z_03270 [Patescibacteria group bacterium]
MKIFFIRDPLTREWKIVLSEPSCFDHIDCSRCDTGRQNQHVITIWKDGRLTPIPPGKQLTAHDNPWDMRVVSFGCPFFRIETKKANHGIGNMIDKMEAPGAHECVEMPAGQILLNLDRQDIFGLLRLYHHRLQELAKDKNLGHPFIFHSDQIGNGQNLSHIIMAPFVVRHGQMELKQLHLHYQAKERCLACDLLTDAADKRPKSHIQIHTELSRFDDFCLYLRPYHNFELWIAPTDECHKKTAADLSRTATTSPATDFKEVTLEQLSPIANLLSYALSLFKERLTKKRMHTQAVGAQLAIYTQPNINWGINRGYWQSILEDFHWTIRIAPIFDPPLTPFGFFTAGTGNEVTLDIEYVKQVLLGK